MKALKKIITLSIIIFACNKLFAQNLVTSTTVYQKIEKLLVDRNFTFNTDFVGETYEGKPILSPNYSLNISQDRILVDLPNGNLTNYNSIAFTSFASGLKLYSTHYYYKAEALNNELWRVSIVPVDDKLVKSMVLTINIKGYANLSVLNKFSKIISYNGSIPEISNY